jgi:hypothetical protein
VIDYWSRYRVILSIRNNAADEGDEEFSAVRVRSFMPIVEAFVRVLNSVPVRPEDEDRDNKRRKVGKIHPLSTAIFLWTGLEAMAMDCDRFEQRFRSRGEGRDEVIESMATMLQTMLSERR